PRGTERMRGPLLCLRELRGQFLLLRLLGTQPTKQDRAFAMLVHVGLDEGNGGLDALQLPGQHKGLIRSVVTVEDLAWVDLGQFREDGPLEVRCGEGPGRRPTRQGSRGDEGDMVAGPLTRAGQAAASQLDVAFSAACIPKQPGE